MLSKAFLTFTTHYKDLIGNWWLFYLIYSAFNCIDWNFIFYYCKKSSFVIFLPWLVSKSALTKSIVLSGFVWPKSVWGLGEPYSKALHLSVNGDPNDVGFGKSRLLIFVLESKRCLLLDLCWGYCWRFFTYSIWVKECL